MPSILLFTDNYCCYRCGVLGIMPTERPIIRLKPHLVKCDLCGTYTMQRLPHKLKRLQQAYRGIKQALKENK